MLVDRRLDRRRQLPKFSTFIYRLVICALVALAVLIVTLACGALGLHYFEKWSWTDSLLNAGLVMTGCGFDKTLIQHPGKIFAFYYTLISTAIYFGILMIVVAPIIHRLMHKFHLEIIEDQFKNY